MARHNQTGQGAEGAAGHTKLHLAWTLTHTVSLSGNLTNHLACSLVTAPLLAEWKHRRASRMQALHFQYSGQHQDHLGQHDHITLLKRSRMQRPYGSQQIYL
jgi:hypothetical protein